MLPLSRSFGIGASGDTSWVLARLFFWNYTTLFVNTFLKNGWEQGQILLHSGRLPRPDLFISVPAWAGNLAVLVGRLIGICSLTRKPGAICSDAWWGLVATLAFFALVVAICQPRYLPLLRGALHPQLHW
jgi:hypothetical protein